MVYVYPAGTEGSCFGTKNEQKNKQNNAIEVKTKRYVTAETHQQYQETVEAAANFLWKLKQRDDGLALAIIIFHTKKRNYDIILWLKYMHINLIKAMKESNLVLKNYIGITSTLAKKLWVKRRNKNLADETTQLLTRKCYWLRGWEISRDIDGALIMSLKLKYIG